MRSNGFAQVVDLADGAVAGVHRIKLFFPANRGRIAARPAMPAVKLTADEMRALAIEGRHAARYGPPRWCPGGQLAHRIADRAVPTTATSRAKNDRLRQRDVSSHSTRKS